MSTYKPPTEEERAENRRLNAIFDRVAALDDEETLALVKDAERYRWLRDRNGLDDAVIDGAMLSASMRDAG